MIWPVRSNAATSYASLFSAALVVLGNPDRRAVDARLRQTAANVILVEMDSARAAALRKRYAGNSRVHVENRIVSGRGGPATLHVFNRAEANSLKAPSALTEHFPKVRLLTRTTVESVGAAAFIAACPLDGDAPNELALDIPGEEGAILEALAASGRLAGFAALRVRAGREPLYEGAESGESLRALLQTHGFQASIAANGAAVLIEAVRRPAAGPIARAEVALAALKQKTATDAALMRELQGKIAKLEQRSREGDLANHARAVRELTQLGRLPEAFGLVQAEVRELKPGTDPRIDVLKSEVEILSQELAQAVKRRQLCRTDEATVAVSGRTVSAEELGRASVSQLGQDLWVLEETGYKRGGFFVEFGATDGLAFSNTWLLESAFGWRGLLAEPNPKFIAKLKRNRGAAIDDACIGPVTGETVDFVFADVFGAMARHAQDDKHGGVRDAYAAEKSNVTRLTTISLHDFLVKHGAPKRIDYISVDTEGSEWEILRAFPFAEWDVRLWTVEHNFTENRGKICTLMEENGYRRKEAQWDDWYFKP